ncbi:DUF6928 family protein [Micromonospora robiginosa]|uniref:Uncharacterized protein n=1 Tax=Micromonospora robiginosa TaxID=2749844 RepID=A0A7L6BDV9_9ACTN|nr:hypothetical protein [Micromonospora ferruginea]QLQ40126.1 hypothetical protein H1D33_15705 [Micromonospora ferruginea]
MGAKTALLAFTDGDIRPALRGATRSERAETEALVRQVHPGYVTEPADDNTLLDGTYPPDDLTYATVLAGTELYCDRRLVLDRPSELPEHLHRAGAGRRIIMHGMHSVVDWLGFAVWEDGVLIRSLSLSPDGGIQENIGKPYDFELPYWAGEHPVKPVPGWHNQDPYPLPFHPLDLGEEALRALFGFIIEGLPSPDDIDADSVHLHGFRVTDPSGEEQAAREAAYVEALQNMGPPRRYRLGPGGTMHEVSPDSY